MRAFSRSSSLPSTSCNSGLVTSSLPKKEAAVLNRPPRRNCSVRLTRMKVLARVAAVTAAS
ncbi:Uncharacterised protein [Mycobacteroides abscessus subsp. abscessus]|nr:Uncharacterised protein [Mycobacteroides abscessus subsp. abscessus]